MLLSACQGSGMFVVERQFHDSCLAAMFDLDGLTAVSPHASRSHASTLAD